jgi:SpoVK/Ycf46/Vps4 family AAA+-type ATPase
MHNTRIVVDDSNKPVESRRGSGLFQDFEDEDSPSIDPESAERYTKVPVAFDIDCFNLDSHNNGWVHMDHMKPYVYRPEIREHLILPAEHEDLIDALTGDMDVLMEDIVSGKGGGTTIICQGKSGTGKTLTAEVYAEVVKRPLYRVHSGQLGIEAGGVETELKKAMERAKRWSAVMLIDEADVFVMQRGSSLELNAVCGVFLRVLEYYDGLLFLTTNRLDSIDDAILSRCIAHVTFDAPGDSERARLWRSLGEVFGLKLAKQKGMDTKLSATFPKATGRDIKGLIRLAIKYARQRKKEVTFDDLKRFAPYKGL